MSKGKLTIVTVTHRVPKSAITGTTSFSGSRIRAEVSLAGSLIIRGTGYDAPAKAIFAQGTWMNVTLKYEDSEDSPE